MKPWELLGRTETPDGAEMTLMRQDREYVILAAGKPLMSSRMHGSEEMLAAVACRHLQAVPAPSILVGGLGMGFTLRAALDLAPPGASVIVSELVAGVVEWNRGPLAALAGAPLADPRVIVEIADVADTLRASRRRFDAVLLDVDNGPDAFTASGNEALYSDAGIAAAREALTDEGILAVWSAWEDRRFEQRLRHGGFDVVVEHPRARLKKGGPYHTIFVGRRSRPFARG